MRNQAAKPHEVLPRLGSLYLQLSQRKLANGTSTAFSFPRRAWILAAYHRILNQSGGKKTKCCSGWANLLDGTRVCCMHSSIPEGIPTNKSFRLTPAFQTHFSVNSRTHDPIEKLFSHQVSYRLQYLLSEVVQAWLITPQCLAIARPLP